MREAAYQSKLIKFYEDEGWYVIKLIKTNRNGCPDLVCIKKDRVLFIEVKAANGKVSKLQQYRIDELKRHGIDAIVKYAPY